MGWEWQFQPVVEESRPCQPSLVECLSAAAHVQPEEWGQWWPLGPLLVLSRPKTLFSHHHLWNAPLPPGTGCVLWHPGIASILDHKASKVITAEVVSTWPAFNRRKDACSAGEA